MVIHTVERDVRTAEEASAAWKTAAVLFAVATLVLGIAAINLQLTVNDLRKTIVSEGSANPVTPHVMPQGSGALSTTPGGMAPDLGPADAQYDRRFIDAMLPHHEAAVIMAHDALKKASRPELRRMAQAIVDSQQKEVKQMRQWQQSWY